jgi:hypothetical protein
LVPAISRVSPFRCTLSGLERFNFYFIKLLRNSSECIYCFKIPTIPGFALRSKRRPGSPIYEALKRNSFWYLTDPDFRRDDDKKTITDVIPATRPKGEHEYQKVKKLMSNAGISIHKGLKLFFCQMISF